MPVYQIDIEKSLNGETWTNVYHVNTDTLASAQAQVANIVSAERAVTCAPVKFTKARVSDMVEDTDNFVIVAINQFGTRAFSLNDMMPLFNVVRVDLTGASGRNGRKYLRGVLVEADQQAAGQLLQNSIDLFQTGYATFIITNTDIGKTDGTAYVDASINPQVGMRQLRRGSKRKLQPVLP